LPAEPDTVRNTLCKNARMTDASEFDPFAPGAQDAWPLLRSLREAAPVATVTGGMPYVTRWSECRAVLRDTTSFSNASGMKAPGVVIPLEDRILGELDPPAHSLVRRVMVSALTPRVVHDAEPFMRETAHALLDALAADAGGDLVPRFTVPLPNRVTVHLLGFPPEDADRIGRLAKELMESEFPLRNRTERGEGFAAAFPEFAGYIDEQLERRGALLAAGEPARDVVSKLLELRIDGEGLTRTQARALTRNLITGGLTTTSQLLGNLFHRLLVDPDLDAAMRADVTLLANAIEESLRTSPPILFVARGCVHATDVAGTEIAPGGRVIVGLGSANRDEAVFVDGETFDAARDNADEHLTFGYGPHVCPGATLARAVARTGITAYLERFPAGTVRLAPGFTFENVPTFFEVGPRELPVRIGS
jgi:cholest-4-en-3-one 26-monooxygenase